MDTLLDREQNNQGVTTMYDKIKSVALVEWRILVASFAAGLVLTMVFAMGTRLYAGQAQQEIAAHVLRFHVLPHSDEADEQALKLAVRDAVLEAYHDVLTATTSRKVAQQLVQAEIGNIEQVAAQVIKDAGKSHNVQVELGSSVFPTRAYGALTFPHGMYDALVIRIGDAIGQNWWCVMFPPLCFVDGTKAELSEQSHAQFAQVLGEDAYGLVLVSQNEGNNGVRVRFALARWWQNRTTDSEEVLLVTAP